MIVLWRISERCNLACGFCAYDRRLPGARQEMDAAQVERFGALLGEYQRTTGEAVLLSWLGGEPLLWPPVFELSQRLHHEHGLRISTTTNGTTLHRPQTRQAIVDTFSELTVSVDGLAAFHDTTRGWPGGWERLRASVRALAAQRERAVSDLKLRANVVLMRNNLAQFAALCDELADWGVDEITFNQLGGRDRPEYFPAHSLRPQDVFELRMLLPELRERLARRHVRLCASDAYMQRIDASAQQQAMPVSDCRPGEQILFIDEVGRVAPCSFTVDSYGIAVTDIVSVADLIALPRRYRAQRTRASAPVCNDCPSTQVFAKFAT